MSNIRSEYLAALKANQAPLVLSSPTEDQVQAVAPHLTPKQVRSLLNSGAPSKVALPPVRVKGAVWIAEFRPENPRNSAPSTLRLLPNSARVSSSRPIPFAAEAAQFAELNWRERMLKDTWGVAQAIYIVDLKNFVDSESLRVISEDIWKGPRSKYLIWAALRGTASQYASRNIEITGLEGWDGLIRTYTDDWVEANEIEGDHGCLTAFICADCSNGIYRTGCPTCNVRLKSESEGSYLFDWTTRLPPRLVRFLQSKGHRFPNLHLEPVSDKPAPKAAPPLVRPYSFPFPHRAT